MNAELTAHFFLTTPPYNITSPTIVCIPTKVAAVICQALSPLLRKLPAAAGSGAGTSAILAAGRRVCLCAEDVLVESKFLRVRDVLGKQMQEWTGALVSKHKAICGQNLESELVQGSHSSSMCDS
jgi:hypothetical protein